MDYFEFTPATSQEPNLPFPREIAESDCVLYHGTSAACEAGIRDRGLTRSLNPFSLSELAALSSIFEELNWAGESNSLNELRGYSLRDHDGAALKPLFLAEHAGRAALYATRKFAGGETARIVRDAFGDLDVYLADEDVRTAHRDKIAALMGAQWREPDPGEVRSRVEALASMRSRATAAFENHSHGVVYAIRVRREDSTFLSNTGNSGVKCFADIPIERIVAYTHVPAEFTWTRVADPGHVPSSRFVRTLRIED